MVNAQTWLESQPEYNTKEKRSRVKKLDIGSKDLEGTLDLKDFTELEELDCWSNKLTSLRLDNCFKLKSLILGYNLLTKLEINHLINLERLTCLNNKLTQLDLTNLNQLISLNCGENKITDLKLPSLGEKLSEVKVSENNLPKQDLSVFSRFVNLSDLNVEGDNFHGSLKPLENLNKMNILNIGNTDIDSGLEYLPEVTGFFYCSADKRKDAKVKTIHDLLVNEPGKDFCEKLRSYRQRLKEKKTYEQGESGLLSTRSELPVIIPAQTELKNIDPANWNRIEISWGDGTMTDWLKKLAEAIRKTNNLVNDRGNNFAVFDFPSSRAGVSKVRDYVRMDWDIVPGVRFPTGNPDIRFASLDLPAPFSYKTQNAHENVACLLWGSPEGSKIFHGQKNKVGTFKNRSALEYLQLIAGDLEIRYKGLSLADEEEILTPPVLTAKAPYTINNPVSTRVNLAYHLKTMSRAERETLKGRLAILENEQTYWKQIKNIDPRHWGIIQLINDNPPFSFTNNGRDLVVDYRNWVSKQNRPDWELPWVPTADSSSGLFRAGFSNSSYFRPVNEGVIHYLKEKYGSREIRVFYARNHNSNNQNRCLEWFADEFLNDEKAYMNNVTPFNSLSPTTGFWVQLSNGSGDLINVRALPKSKRNELKDRRIIIWDNVTDYPKFYKDVKTDNLADIRIPLHGFSDLVAKVKAADEEKTKLGRANERLLAADSSFGNQSMLDEWKRMINAHNRTLNIIPIGGNRKEIKDLTISDRLQGGDAAVSTNSPGWDISGVNYKPTGAYELVVAALLSTSNTWFRNSQGNYTSAGLDFLKKMVKPADWEQLEARVDYRQFHRLRLEEFMNDNLRQDLWAFLIDEDRALVSSTATSGVINPLQITALNQKIDSLQTQLTAQQGKINTLLELMTGVPVAEESSELRAQIRQVDLPPFNK